MSALLVSCHLVTDPTIWLPSFDLPCQQWCELNHIHTACGQCGACWKKRRLTDCEMCTCGKLQTMSHIANSCPNTKLDGRLLLHSADDHASNWPMSLAT